MKSRYEPESDTVSLRLDESPAQAIEEVYPGVVVHFNADDRVIGVEILRVREGLPGADVTHMEFEVGP